jgi:ABC-type transport system involved in Fe-S cluster assembly fused permease/ATPase subunit
LKWLSLIFLILSAGSVPVNVLGAAIVTLMIMCVIYNDWYHSTNYDNVHAASELTETNDGAATVTSPSLPIDMLTLLKPYFWPDATTSTALWNRIRAISTWIFLIASKTCDLTAPILVGQASTALAHQDYVSTIRYSIYYAALVFCGVVLDECKSLVYLQVSQAAFVQLSEATFDHLHSLSLDWHLNKKLGEVLRGVDRGIAACDTVMKYLFMWLVPALGECLVVTIIFATYFQYLPLALSVFSFVFFYIVWTILVTLWRRQFRHNLVSSDNGETSFRANSIICHCILSSNTSLFFVPLTIEWHDRLAESLLHFETVKSFTAEDYERERFSKAVSQYQAGSIDVQVSLSFLNISQRLVLQVCLGTALVLTARGIQQRLDCCTEAVGCSSGVSECCQSVGIDVCPGMQVGDFVAVLSYILSLFAPLNFLGSMYNAVLMGLVDLGTLSKIFCQAPDIIDAKDALKLPRYPPLSEQLGKKAIAVEFDNVTFRYPSQTDNKIGLRGISFQMKHGTTTAIVGQTGAGKTTISRLILRYYDVLGGSVKVNGMDVRCVSQKSLREAIGVVPQSVGLFNDTLRANLAYGDRFATENDLRRAAKDAQLLDFIESLNDGWEARVGDRGLKLSGGEKQRVAIARCLLKNPPIVILDEASTYSKARYGTTFSKYFLCTHCLLSLHGWCASLILAL